MTLLTAFCSVAVPEGAPEWVHLIPAGTINDRDGRLFRVSDPEGIIARSRALGMELVIDFEHQTEYAPKNGQPAPAAGWIVDFEVRGGEVWGRVNWTDRGRAMLEAREYRYLSPVFNYDKSNLEIKVLLRAGLTNNPAFPLEAIVAAHRNEDLRLMEELLKKLRAALGLADTASAEDIETAALAASQASTALAHIAKTVAPNVTDATAIATAAIAATTPDPARFVPLAQHQELAGQLATLRSQRSEETVNTAVGQASREGKLMPAQRDWALAYARKDLEGFNAWAASAPVIVNPEGQSIVPPPSGDPGTLTTEERAMARRMGLTEDEFLKAKKEAN